MPLVPLVWFARDGAGWRAGAEPRGRAGAKRPGVAGPLDDVLRHPVWIVYGTQDPVQTEANRMTAEHLALYDAFSGGRFPVKPDHEVRDGDLAGTCFRDGRVIVHGTADAARARAFADRWLG